VSNPTALRPVFRRFERPPRWLQVMEEAGHEPKARTQPFTATA